jgi:RTX toxin acyltransferase family
MDQSARFAASECCCAWKERCSNIRQMFRKRKLQMPDTRKSARGAKRMNKAGAAKRTEPPLFGEAALQEALAELGGTPSEASRSNAPHASGNGAAAGQAQAAPPPKTVSQVLGEITWLMTQSPRHRSIPLGDLEWLLMPAILLKQFRIFGRKAGRRRAMGARRRYRREADRRQRQAPHGGRMEERHQHAHRRHRRAVRRRGGDVAPSRGRLIVSCPFKQTA